VTALLPIHRALAILTLVVLLVAPLHRRGLHLRL